MMVVLIVARRMGTSVTAMMPHMIPACRLTDMARGSIHDQMMVMM